MSVMPIPSSPQPATTATCTNRGMDKPSGKGSTASYEELKKISPQMYEEIMSIKKEMESAEVNQMAKDIQKMVKDMESEME